MQITQILATHIQSHSLSVMGNYQSKEKWIKIPVKSHFFNKNWCMLLLSRFVYEDCAGKCINNMNNKGTTFVFGPLSWKVFLYRRRWCCSDQCLRDAFQQDNQRQNFSPSCHPKCIFETYLSYATVFKKILYLMFGLQPFWKIYKIGSPGSRLVSVLTSCGTTVRSPMTVCDPLNHEKRCKSWQQIQLTANNCTDFSQICVG